MADADAPTASPVAAPPADGVGSGEGGGDTGPVNLEATASQELPLASRRMNRAPSKGAEAAAAAAAAEPMDADSTAKVVDILQHLPFFRKLETQARGTLQRLGAVATRTQEPAGAVMFRQGDPPENCYIVLSGQVDVLLLREETIQKATPRRNFPPDRYATYKDHVQECASLAEHQEPPPRNRFCTAEGKSTFAEWSSMGERVATLTPGSLFGELALLNDATRASTIRCTADCEMLVLAKEHYALVKQDLARASEEQVINDFCSFLETHYGSVMKAWRIALDPNVLGELMFSEFVSSLSQLAWQGNTPALWGSLMRRAAANGRGSVVSLAELASEEHAALESYRTALDRRYGGAVAMFMRLTGNIPNALMQYEAFVQACDPDGELGHHELIWNTLESENEKGISLKEVAFLEMDGLQRRGALDPRFEMDMEAAKAAALVAKRRCRDRRKAQENAFTEFRHRLRLAGAGSVVRSYRKVLDRTGNMMVSKVEVLKGLRQIAFNGDAVALWKALDQDNDGSVHLQDIDVQSALILASFRNWASVQHGSCVEAMWSMAPSRRRKIKWNVEEFAVALSGTGWPGVPGVPFRQSADFLHESLDDGRTRSVKPDDAAFLDNWEPTPWLIALPDEAGRSLFVAGLRDSHPNLMFAWKQSLDRANRNRVFFTAFSECCEQLHLANTAGVWRAMDRECKGFITFEDLDPESARVLLCFKKWCEDRFGSIQYAFSIMEKGYRNGMSLTVFKRALHDFNFPHDSKELFDLLKPGASKGGGREAHVRVDDVMHLVHWEFFGEEDVDLPEASVAPSHSHAKKSSLAPPQGAKRKSLNVQDGAAAALATGTASASLRALSGAAARDPGDPSRSTETRIQSDFLHYCRNPKEYEIWTEVVGSGEGPDLETLQRQLILRGSRSLPSFHGRSAGGGGEGGGVLGAGRGVGGDGRRGGLGVGDGQSRGKPKGGMGFFSAPGGGLGVYEQSLVPREGLRQRRKNRLAASGSLIDFDVLPQICHAKHKPQPAPGEEELQGKSHTH